MLAAVLVSACISSRATAPSGEIKKFSPGDEIRDYIKNNTQIEQDENYSTDVVVVPAPAPVIAAQKSAAKGGFPIWCTPISRGHRIARLLANKYSGCRC
jgi:hypothetical protein